MTWQQFLTENVLKECYHDGRTPFNCGFKCRKCGNTFTINRTYNNRNDMMDLYEAIWKDGKWSKYETFVHIIWMNDDKLLPGENIRDNYIKWLFCLSGEGYEDRCKMVAEFYWWEEKMGQYI